MEIGKASEKERLIIRLRQWYSVEYSYSDKSHKRVIFIKQKDPKYLIIKILWSFPAEEGGFRSLASAIPVSSPEGPLQKENSIEALRALGVVPLYVVARASSAPPYNKTTPQLRCDAVSHLRKKGDSNPRYPVKGIPVFETSAFSHSAILPLGLQR